MVKGVAAHLSARRHRSLPLSRGKSTGMLLPALLLLAPLVAFLAYDPSGFWSARVAQHAFSSGRYEEASQGLAAALERRPTDVTLLKQYGIALLAGERREEALHSFERAVALDPTDRHAAQMAANALASLGARGGAATNGDPARLERALRLDPRRPDLYLSLGALLLSTGAKHRAREAFARAVELAPDEATTYLSLATVQLSLDDVAATRQSLHSATLLQPSSLAAHTTLFLLGPPSLAGADALHDALIAQQSHDSYRATLAANLVHATRRNGVTSAAGRLSPLRVEGYAVVDSLLGAEMCDALRTHAQRELRPLQTRGTVGRHEGMVQQATRSDMVLRLPSDLLKWRLSDSLVDAIGRLRVLFAEIHAELLQLWPLHLPFPYPKEELMYACYDAGGFYSRHVDSARRTSAAGEGAPAVDRMFTAVYYLDGTFEGGELRLHLQGAEAEGEQDGRIDLPPSMDRLVIFWSNVSHEVLPILTPGAIRCAFTQWFSSVLTEGE